MEGAQLLAALLELARESGLRVRVVRRAAEVAPGDPPPRSGVAILLGEPFVLISELDPVEERIEAVAQAVRRHAPQVLEGRYLPPAVRERLERSGSGSA